MTWILSFWLCRSLFLLARSFWKYICVCLDWMSWTGCDLPRRPWPTICFFFREWSGEVPGCSADRQSCWKTSISPQGTPLLLSIVLFAFIYTISKLNKSSSRIEEINIRISYCYWLNLWMLFSLRGRGHCISDVLIVFDPNLFGSSRRFLEGCLSSLLGFLSICRL